MVDYLVESEVRKCVEMLKKVAVLDTRKVMCLTIICNVKTLNSTTSACIFNSALQSLTGIVMQAAVSLPRPEYIVLR